MRSLVAWILLPAIPLLAEMGTGTANSAEPVPVSATAPAAAAPAIVIYTKENPTAAPKLGDLPLKESISQYGITWTFEKPARVGQFVNGDFYVVGPVTIKAIDPAPLRGKDVPEGELDSYDRKVPRENHLRNGSMVNPPPRAQMAYDSGLRHSWAPDLIRMPPYSLKPGDNIVSTISLKIKEVAAVVGYGNSSRSRAKHDNCPIKVSAVLTCMEAPLPPDAFRPAYSDANRQTYFARDLRRDLLPKLERVAGCPDPVKYSTIFQRMWLNPGFFGFDEPMENMPHYGQQVCQAVSDAGLLLCLDFKPEEKEPLLVHFVQVGIDYWGLVKNGHHGWEGFGGHGSGRKFPIVFAGCLLDDDKMANVGMVFPACEFGEDNQTAYGDCWTGAKVVFTGHGAVSTQTGKVLQDKSGPYEHMHPTNWNRGGRKDTMSEGYRRNNTSCAWVGEALAMHVLKIEKQWAHDAFFDYMDRWMHEDDKPLRIEIDKYFPNSAYLDDSKTWCHEGNPGEAWIGALWKKYRTAADMPPTDGWKTLKANPGGWKLPAEMKADPRVKPADRKAASKPAETAEQ